MRVASFVIVWLALCVKGEEEETVEVVHHIRADDRRFILVGLLR